MRGREIKGEAERWQGMTENEKDGQCWGKGKTSVLKPACTLPERMLQEGFVGNLPTDLTCKEAWAKAAEGQM